PLSGVCPDVRRQEKAVILPPLLPQLHDTANIPRGKDPPDVVEVPDKNAAICSTSKGQRRQQFVALCLSITAGAGDAASTTVSCGHMF
ncbi:hypothetical protein XENOCAPTIV_000617, partial [Xenoophorus captivus]